MFCPNCKNILTDGTTICDRCGENTAQPPPQQQYQQPQYPQPPQQTGWQQPPPTKYCQKCANVLFVEAVVCPRCGCSCASAGAYGYALSSEPDIPNAGKKMASFFIPLLGFYWYYSMKATKPISAKAYNKYALIACLPYTILFFLGTCQSMLQ